VSKERTEWAAKKNLLLFFERNELVYYWTFTFPGDDRVKDKDEAERRFKPFKDLVNRRHDHRRRKGEMIYFWERQKDGTWHVHLVTNLFLHVNWVRPWMMARGWGQQMRADVVVGRGEWRKDGDARGVWRPYGSGVGKVIHYLTKYLTKGFGNSNDRAAATKKKMFSGTARTKSGTTNFKWMPDVHPGSYLWAWGRALFAQLNGHPPSFKNVGEVIRLGVEVTQWADVDPWWEFSFPSG